MVGFDKHFIKLHILNHRMFFLFAWCNQLGFCMLPRKFPTAKLHILPCVHSCMCHQEPYDRIERPAKNISWTSSAPKNIFLSLWRFCLSVFYHFFFPLPTRSGHIAQFFLMQVHESATSRSKHLFKAMLADWTNIHSWLRTWHFSVHP